DWPSALWMLLCGYLNFWMVVYMGKAMLRGPNGIVWTIVQSGFIFSFTLGVVWDPAFENLIKGQTICFPALRLTRNCPIFNLVLTWVNHYGVIFTLLARRRRLSRQGRVC
ncbi:MAG: hypothetical protein IJP66_07915, partial [Kiritimatiellae bacterium]|nr:hypothetical protein [Kiritimatiellia bacterium]